MQFYYGALGSHLGASMDKDSGNWTFSNNVTADYYYGDGSHLTGLNSTNASYYLASNPFSFYNVTTAPIYTNDTFAGNYSDFLDKITWGEATNGTLLTEETFTQTEFNTNYTANDEAYRIDTGINWSDAVNGTLLTEETFTQTEFNTNYTANNDLWLADNWNTSEQIWTVVDNQTFYLKSNPYSFYNSTDFSILDYLTKTLWNTNYTANNDLWLADEDTFAGNYSAFLALPTLAEIDAFGFYNSTDFSISDYSTTTAIDSWGFYNSTDFSIGDYYLKTNPFGFYNSTNPQSVTETLWNGNFTNVAYLNSNNQFSENQNMTNHNITYVECVTFKNGAQWCGL